MNIFIKSMHFKINIEMKVNINALKLQNDILSNNKNAKLN